MNCKICGDTSSAFFESPYGVIPNRYADTPSQFFHFEFELKQCVSCKAVESIHQISDKEMFGAYVYKTPTIAFMENSIQFLKSQISIDESTRVAEVGANNCLFLDQLAVSFGVSTSLFLAIDRVKPLANFQGRHINSFLSDALIIDQALNAKFDVVIMRHCLAHNSDIQQLARAASKLLVDGGYLYVENADLGQTVKNSDFGQFYPEHYFSLTSTAVDILFDGYGLSRVASVDLEIHNGSFGLLLQKNNSGAYSKFSTVLTINDSMSKWVLEGSKRFENGRKNPLYLWGASAKAVFSLNLFSNGQVNFLDAVIDSTYEKVGKYPPGFTVAVADEKSVVNLSGVDVCLGAPNFEQLIKNKIACFRDKPLSIFAY